MDLMVNMMDFKLDRQVWLNMLDLCVQFKVSQTKDVKVSPFKNYYFLGTKYTSLLIIVLSFIFLARLEDAHGEISYIFRNTIISTTLLSN